MFITTMPDLGNLVSTSSLPLTRCSNSSRPGAMGNRDLCDPKYAKESETSLPVQDECNRDRSVKINKSVESKSLNDYWSDWVSKNVELGVPESKLFLPFLVGAPKLVKSSQYSFMLTDEPSTL